MFVDKASISVKAGDGGNGAVSFHREKYVAAGGPDGGDGGRGGDIVLRTDPNMSTLMDFRYKRKYAAGNGENGQAKNCSGKDGVSLTIKVPNGTLVKDRESGAIIRDMTGETAFTVARGGSGGWGNSHFATPTRQAPRFAKSGLKGESREIILELKLLADVGLVGFPNVGKSTLLAALSKAHPKIADYPFTTLYPNLGVVYVGEGTSFVMADIPGIIGGAAEGVGLGHDFLRHIERCRLLIHVVDLSGREGRDPIEDFETINKELASYSPALAKRPQIVAANKSDIVSDPAVPEAFRRYVTERGCDFFEISAATHAGLKELSGAIAAALAKLPQVSVFEPDYKEKQLEAGSPDELKIEVFDDVWVVGGEWLEHLVRDVNFDDYESRMYFDRVLRGAGVFERLEKMGIHEGDTVSICEIEFEYRR